MKQDEQCAESSNRPDDYKSTGGVGAIQNDAVIMSQWTKLVLCKEINRDPFCVINDF
jgi:hypothetical protein